MGYSWMYLGDAEIPDDRVDGWLADVLGEGDPTLLTALATWGFEPSDPALTVADVLARVADGEVARVETRPRVVVRALADKGTDAWLTWRGDLVHAFVALARHGGRGSLTIAGFFDGPEEGAQIDIGERVVGRDLEEQEVMSVRSGSAAEDLLALVDAFYGG